MGQRLLSGFIFICLGAGICRGESKVVTFFSPTQLEESITTHSENYDYLLIDLRDPFEVAGGIIASQYCRPYHLSWNYGELKDNYQLLPDTMRILLYCHTGNRAMDAANFLSGKGYEKLGCLTNGARAYGGELRDSSEFKPLRLLPEPSYFGDTTLAVTNTHRSFFMAPGTNEPGQIFTLQGRIMPQHAKRNNFAAAFLIIHRNSKTMSVLRSVTR